jgi:hypothetical protein
MGFQTKKHYTRSVRLDDERLVYGVSIEVSHWLQDQSGEPRIVSILKTYAGPFDMQISITADQARELSAILLEHADEIEAHQSWFDAKLKASGQKAALT